ncbi:DUF3099 domain-containing protein [Jatrophihabitans endophyticus]|uniref:DUF3099 domain-containing protein n=1 Tax=Jatrophihabitans endophyticus TaxID=1206085 RepID=UPI0019EFB0B0|nr:DUF3099 domain-containing protein [Jatrophihabitans endophyticus]MBE7186864.1 DUF3099 domain-containing protein [Jatrophihabitans endophyticus]
MRRTRAEEPVLITSAHENPDDEYAHRRKRYAITMTIRALCVLGAALTYQVDHLLPLAFIAAAVVLPWCAVIMANDRPAKKRAAAPAYGSGTRPERALTAGDEGRTVDG